MGYEADVYADEVVEKWALEWVVIGDPKAREGMTSDALWWSWLEWAVVLRWPPMTARAFARAWGRAWRRHGLGTWRVGGGPARHAVRLATAEEREARGYPVGLEPEAARALRGRGVVWAPPTREASPRPVRPVAGQLSAGEAAMLASRSRAASRTEGET